LEKFGILSIFIVAYPPRIIFYAVGILNLKHRICGKIKEEISTA